MNNKNNNTTTNVCVCGNKNNNNRNLFNNNNPKIIIQPSQTCFWSIMKICGQINDPISLNRNIIVDMWMIYF